MFVVITYIVMETHLPAYPGTVFDVFILISIYYLNCDIHNVAFVITI